MENTVAAPPSPVSYASVLKGNSPAPSPPATPPSSPCLSPPYNPSFPSPISSTPTLSTAPPSPQTLPSSPPRDDTVAEPHWAFSGRLAWLGTGMIGPRSVIRQRLTSQQEVDGFENHPVLIWSAPDEDGTVRVIPVTSYGGRRAEAKWSKMNHKKRWAKLQQLLMLENGTEEPHRGTERLLFAEPFSCRKRSYLYIEHGIYHIEVDCLRPYTNNGKTELVLADSAMRYIAKQLHHHVLPSLWVNEKDAGVQVSTASDDAKDLTRPPAQPVDQ